MDEENIDFTSWTIFSAPVHEWLQKDTCLIQESFLRIQKTRNQTPSLIKQEDPSDLLKWDKPTLFTESLQTLQVYWTETYLWKRGESEYHLEAILDVVTCASV